MTAEREEFACPRCGGMGWVEVKCAYNPSIFPDCPNCDGAGVVDKDGNPFPEKRAA